MPLLLFGAMGGGRDPRKGFDLLTPALVHLRGEIPGLELVVLGQLTPRNPPDLGFPIHYTGHLQDELSLRALYSAADALVVPSRQDNLPIQALRPRPAARPWSPSTSAAWGISLSTSAPAILPRRLRPKTLLREFVGCWVMDRHGFCETSQ